MRVVASMVIGPEYVSAGTNGRDAAARRTRIVAIKRVVNRRERGSGHRHLLTRRDIAARRYQRDRADPLGVEEVRALLEIILEPLNFRRLAGSDRVERAELGASQLRFACPHRATSRVTRFYPGLRLRRGGDRSALPHLRFAKGYCAAAAGSCQRSMYF